MRQGSSCRARGEGSERVPPLIQLTRSRTVEDYAIDVPSVIFFVFLFSVLITLYDRYRPEHAERAPISR